jgi:Ser/Thr protein kinase RdoA (MazF antagonist)
MNNIICYTQDMNSNHEYLKRIQFTGDIKILLQHICHEYDLSKVENFEVLTFGYEDLNIKFSTIKGIFVVKVMASWRKEFEVKRYISIINQIIKAGISHPKIYASKQGLLTKLKFSNSKINCFVMDYINGQSFYQLGIKPNDEERRTIIREAFKINNISFKPEQVYDSWAVLNIINEFEKNKECLFPEDKVLIQPVIEQCKYIKVNELPHTFVHGDLISTNVMKAKSGKIYIIDFSVANWYPRVIELAVLLCDLFFDPAKYKEIYEQTLEEYNSYLMLTTKEIELLPLFIKAAHAMHIIGSTSEKTKGNNEVENNHWLEHGRRGLKVTNQTL